MSPELEDFRQQLISHAKLAVSRAAKIESEASTNTSLVQPFLVTLGYDVGNPDEVSPEHHADFAEKYQNKVDYAILREGIPVIALESKCVGSPLKDDRGQLRSYFNACPTVKLGILTDGLKYELYADCDKQNMMDDVAFLRFDLVEVAKDGNVDENTLDGIAAIRKGFFNPEDVGAEAKRKLLFESFINIIKKFKSDPSDEFIKFIIGQSEVGSKIIKVTQKIVEANREVVRAAMEAFVAQEALSRFGYAPKDVVKTMPGDEGQQKVILPEPEEAVFPSEAEISALTYGKNRLFYLVRNDVLFQEVQKITFKKTKTSFRVYYEKPNNGSLFDYHRQKDGKAVLQFPALGGKEIPYVFSAELDDCLLKAFTKRVSEAGISFDSKPSPNAIKSGQATPGA
jgi:hypothetical protein